MNQRYCGAKTSVNQLPAIARLVDKYAMWMRFTINVDLGCGAYPDRLSEYLEGHLVYNMPVDPFHGFKPDLRLLKILPVQSVTISNVLNVIKEKSERRKLLLKAKSYRPRYIFITVYEGDKSGRGRKTRDNCWQAHKRTEAYLSELKEIFKKGYADKVRRHGKLITIYPNMK